MKKQIIIAVIIGLSVVAGILLALYCTNMYFELSHERKTNKEIRQKIKGIADSMQKDIKYLSKKDTTILQQIGKDSIIQKNKEYISFDYYTSLLYLKTKNSIDTYKDKLYILTNQSEINELTREIHFSYSYNFVSLIISGLGLVGFILILFYKGFKVDSIDKKNLLEWVSTNSELTNSITNLTLKKAEILKKIDTEIDSLSEDKKNSIRSKVINYADTQIEELKSTTSPIYPFFIDIKSRLREECKRLNLQGLISLLISFLIAFSIIVFLWYTNNNNINENKEFEIFMIKSMPRFIAIGTFITLFIYFTKLYKTTIIDVKYYQNELTNIEIKHTAIETALFNKDNDTITKIISELSIIDRNKVITKEQTTSEIERLKIENELNKDLSSKILDLLSIGNKKNK